MKTFILNNRWALGDTVCLSAFVRDLHIAYPGQYRTFMMGHYASYWRHCPYAQIHKDQPGQVIVLEYGDAIKECARGMRHHFLTAFHDDFRRKTRIKVPVTAPKGEIFLSEERKKESPYPFRYWVVMAGSKFDMPVKQWDIHCWQETINRLSLHGIRCVQAGADFHKNYHPRLEGVEQAIGKTDDIHDLFRWIYHSEGVICGITSAMHIAAAFDKPCVIVAGGREDWYWEGYTNNGQWPNGCAQVKVPHRFLHTVGLLDCRQDNQGKSYGCWKDLVVPLERVHTSSSNEIKRLCKHPLRMKHQNLPECMRLITPDHVQDGVLSYYREGTLPPMSNATKYVWKLVETNETVDAGDSIPPVNPSFKTVVLANPLPYTHSEQAKVDFPREFVAPQQEDSAFSILDHPIIGGKLTVFILGYGDHLDLMKRCLGSIIETCPTHRLDIRVALNQPSMALLTYVNGFKGIVSHVYENYERRRKYEAMREMFWDANQPIATRYLLWFDDDSWANQKDWLILLANTIIKNHAQGCRLYGTKCIHDLMIYKELHPEKWFREARWWKNKCIHLAKGRQTGPNGHEIVFVTGGFWALDTEAMRAADIPDIRLVHNGGDIVIGEQIHQAGFKICDFSRNKVPVRWSDAGRRGYHEEFPWSKRL